MVRDRLPPRPEELKPRTRSFLEHPQFEEEVHDVPVRERLIFFSVVCVFILCLVCFHEIAVPRCVKPKDAGPVPLKLVSSEQAKTRLQNMQLIIPYVGHLRARLPGFRLVLNEEYTETPELK